MLKKLGYVSYLLGLEGIIFVIYILQTENIKRSEPILILAGITIVSIVQMMFVTFTLKKLQNRSYNNTGAIDEYLSQGIEDDQVVMQLPVIWKIIGWVALISSLGVGVVGVAVFSEYVFNRWKSFDIFSVYAFVSIIISFISVVYTLGVINRRWIGNGKINTIL